MLGLELVQCLNAGLSASKASCRRTVQVRVEEVKTTNGKSDGGIKCLFLMFFLGMLVK